MRTLLILLALAGPVTVPQVPEVLAASDQDAARDATRTGRIKPLQQILSTVGREVPGRVVDVQLDKGTSPWTYRIKVINEAGNVVNVTVNAETGRIQSVRGRR